MQAGGSVSHLPVEQGESSLFDCPLSDLKITHRIRHSFVWLTPHIEKRVMILILKTAFARLQASGSHGSVPGGLAYSSSKSIKTPRKAKDAIKPKIRISDFTL